MGSKGTVAKDAVPALIRVLGDKYSPVCEAVVKTLSRNLLRRQYLCWQRHYTMKMSLAVPTISFHLALMLEVLSLKSIIF